MDRGPFLAALVAFGACVAGVAPVAHAQRLPITNGAEAPDDVPVVGLLYDGVLRCTGTLVSSNVVLTAAHCVHYATPTGVALVGRSGSQVAEVSVVRTMAHPAFDADDLANDIGGVVLAEAAPSGFSPVPVQASGPVVDGSELRLVGFGRSAALAEDEGVRRQGTAVVDAVDPLTFRYRPSPSQACIGDSGGPAFATIDGSERLVGVTSSGDTFCMTHGVNSRVDAYFPGFIEPLLDVVPGAEPGDFGADCQSSFDCASNVCRAEPDGAGTCTQRCDPTEPICPDSTACTPGTLLGADSGDVDLCSPYPDAGCSAGVTHPRGRGADTVAWLLPVVIWLLVRAGARRSGKIRGAREPSIDGLKDIRRARKRWPRPTHRPPDGMGRLAAGRAVTLGRGTRGWP